MALTAAQKLQVLHRMIKKLNARVQYLSNFIKNDKELDRKLRDEMTDIDKELE